MQARIGPHLCQLDATCTFDPSRVFAPGSALLTLPLAPLELASRDDFLPRAATTKASERRLRDDGDEHDDDDDSASANRKPISASNRDRGHVLPLRRFDSSVRCVRIADVAATAGGSVAYPSSSSSSPSPAPSPALPPLQFVVVSNAAAASVAQRPRVRRELDLECGCHSAGTVFSLTSHGCHDERGAAVADDASGEAGRRHHHHTTTRTALRSAAAQHLLQQERGVAHVAHVAALAGRASLQAIPVSQMMMGFGGEATTQMVVVTRAWDASARRYSVTLATHELRGGEAGVAATDEAAMQRAWCPAAGAVVEGVLRSLADRGGARRRGRPANRAADCDGPARPTSASVAEELGPASKRWLEEVVGAA